MARSLKMTLDTATKIYESTTAASEAESKYEWRLNINDLADFSDTRLLSFGPEMEKFNQKIEDNQLFKPPLTGKDSDRVADLLGGKGIKEEASKRVKRSQMQSARIEDSRALEHTDSETPTKNEMQQEASLNPKPPKGGRKSNRPKLMDPTSPKSKTSDRAHPAAITQLATSKNLAEDFPSFNDSQDEPDDEDDMDDLNEFHELKSNLDGLNLDRFLFPVLESMIVSKGSNIIGTPRSTFSSYVENVLYPAYLSSTNFPPSSSEKQSRS
ncbi:hypothetical protein KEM48_010251 [Puccinia striiformis f. sp. tritici PST-130]|nr:hypothetical protein KEM48_010251 [Puccinia striiformis f. sp. tritici PST-130]